MSKAMIKKSILVISVMILFMTAVYLIWDNTKFKVDKDLSKINLEGIDNLMIIAHPDDDMLWGGHGLIQDDYFVVCVTCGTNYIRVTEFKKVMKETNDKYVMLGYPDVTHGSIDDWKTSQDLIIKDLDKIIKIKDWKKIVVHNPDGEYGHEHHKKLSKYTTNLVDAKEILYYFGHYYSAKNLPSHADKLTKLDDEMVKKKEDILKLYYSQSKTVKNLKHFHAYENWLSYDEWMNEANEQA